MRMIGFAVILSTLALGLGALVLSQGKAQDMVDITASGPNGLPIIFWRIEQDNRDEISKLIAAGLDIEIKGFQQATPVLAAASANAWITTELLLGLGGDPMASDRMGFTLPWLAAKAQMSPGAPEGQALARVRRDLEARGLMARIYEPAEVKALRDRGAWPPG